MPKGKTEFRLSTRGKLFCIGLTHGLNVYIRFRDVSTFGGGTIRRFAANVSEMKKLAGRDFEDILQVISILRVFIGQDRSMSSLSEVHYSCHRRSPPRKAQRQRVGSSV